MDTHQKLHTSQGAYRSPLAYPDTVTLSIFSAKRMYTTYTNPYSALRSVSPVVSGLTLWSQEDELKDVNSLPIHLLDPAMRTGFSVSSIPSVFPLPT